MSDQPLVGAFCYADSILIDRLKRQDEVHWKTRRSLLKRIEGALAVIERVEARCMATDGPVTPTLQEMREDEMREIYLLLKGEPESGAGRNHD